MHKKLFYLLTAVVIPLMFSVTSYSKSSTIPLEDFAKHAKYNQIKISPDGKHLAFSFRDGTEVKLAVINRNSKKVTGIFEFGEYRQVSSFYWGNNDRVIMQVQKFVGYLDKKGGPTHIYAANIDGTHRKQIFTSSGSFVRIASILKQDNDHIALLKTHGSDMNPAKDYAPVTAVKLNIYTGRISRINGQPKEDVGVILFDPNDEMRIAARYEPDEERFGWGTYTIYIRKPGTDDWRLSSLSQETDARFNFRGISADSKKAYMTTDEGNDKGISALYELDLITEKKTLVFQSDLVDVGSMITTEDDAVIGVNYQSGFNEVFFTDKSHRETKALASLYQAFPGQDVSFTSYTKDGSKAITFVRSDINPGEFYVYDFNNNELKYVASRMPWIKASQMAQMTPVSYETRDGYTIHGYLTLPKNSKTDLPLIIHPHGGPHGPRDNWGFNPDVQFMASRGYAVLQMNFRGSGGYGQAFERSGYRKWGREMQNDVTDATYWAIKKGIADKNRICIYGGSYGGYATLMGVVKEPNLYQCALGYVGVYDLETMFTAGDIPRRESGVKYLEHVLGTDKKVLAENSPARNVEKIKAALFIAHGENDERVPMEQYDVLTEALDEAGISYRSMVKPEGHGYQLYDNRVEFYQAMEEFFAKHLGN